MKPDAISLRPALAARVLGAVALFLVLASTAGQLLKYVAGYEGAYGLIPLFRLDGEQNLPTLFATLLLVFASQLLALIALLDRNRSGSHSRQWAVLSFGFLFMAIDETVALHERLIEPMRALLGGGELGVFHFAWVVPGIAVVLLLVPFFLRFVLGLPSRTRVHLLAAAALYLGGAIGLELIGGSYAELHRTRNLTYSMITTVEESLEMAGVIVLIRGLLAHIADEYGEIRVHMGAPRDVRACPSKPLAAEGPDEMRHLNAS